MHNPNSVLLVYLDWVFQNYGALMVQWGYALKSCGMNGIKQLGPMILVWLSLHFLV